MLSRAVTPAKAGVRCLCLALAFASPAAPARDGVAPDVRVLFDGIEPEVDGLVVQVYDDARAPQLVLDNRTRHALEVLDEKGRLQLRIRPQASWGWFDRRLDRARVRLPEDDRHLAAVLGQWRVPARLGRQAIVLRGHFQYEPPAQGVFVSRLTGAGGLAPDVQVTLSTGEPPALLLENAGAEPVVVLGGVGEPFLRLTRTGVEANLHSPTWRALGRHRGLAAASNGKVQWRRVSKAPRYRWLEPRAGRPAAGETERAWQVPLRIGDRPAAIRGVTEWRAAVY